MELEWIEHTFGDYGSRLVDLALGSFVTLDFFLKHCFITKLGFRILVANIWYTLRRLKPNMRPK